MDAAGAAMISKPRKGKESYRRQRQWETWTGCPGTIREHGPARSFSVDFYSSGMGRKGDVTSSNPVSKTSLR